MAKIQGEDFASLKDAIERTIAITDAASTDGMTAVERYAANGLTHMRFRWDVLNASRWLTGDNCTRVYAYANDDHIDTALRSILGKAFPSA